MDQPRCRHRAVADVLHEDAVGGACDRERHRDACGREALQHREFVVGPVLPEDSLAVPRALGRGATVTAVPDRSAVAVGTIVHEVRGALEAERLQLTLVRDGARAVPLVREQARAAVGRDALDEEDFGFLAGLERPEVVFVVRLGLGDQPWRAHATLLHRESRNSRRRGVASAAVQRGAGGAGSGQTCVRHHSTSSLGIAVRTASSRSGSTATDFRHGRRRWRP